MLHPLSTEIHRQCSEIEEVQVAKQLLLGVKILRNQNNEYAIILISLSVQIMTKVAFEKAFIAFFSKKSRFQRMLLVCKVFGCQILQH